MIPHYWNPQQVERLLDALAALGLRRARVAALIMWRSGLRVGETVALEWRDIDVAASSRFRLLLGYWVYYRHWAYSETERNPGDAKDKFRG